MTLQDAMKQRRNISVIRCSECGADCNGDYTYIDDNSDIVCEHCYYGTDEIWQELDKFCQDVLATIA